MSVMPVAPMALAAPTEQLRETGADKEEVRAMSASHEGIRQRLWGLEARTDPNVTYEEWTFWAKIEREMEDEEYRIFRAGSTGGGFLAGVKSYFTKNPYEDGQAPHDNSRALQPNEERTQWDEKSDKQVIGPQDGIGSPIAPSLTHTYDAEWRRAARALRVSSWLGVFYLITTDILGWNATPSSFAAVGYGQGVGIFLLMGIAATVSAVMLWRVFLGLDSSRFPMLSFGDPFFRVFGPLARHLINVAQSLQQFCTVAVIVLSNGQIISQLANAQICFIACLIITMAVGMLSGLMRSLKHLGWFCNLAVWLNVATFILVCVAAAKLGPDPTVAVQAGVLPKEWLTNPAPVATFIDTPPAIYQQTTRDIFAAKFSGGINNMVYSYAGTILFVAFMSEMRRPMDFWKAMLCAYTFITVVYIFFGAFVYSYFGQYSYSLINQAVNGQGYQIASNALVLITTWLAVFLYFNVGFKTVYLEVGQELLNFPPIITRKGRVLWYTLGPVYWILAFVVAASIPQFQSFTGFIGGFFGINFTYSFPGLLYTGYVIVEGARLPGEGFDPRSGTTIRHDSGVKRWVRGFVKNWYLAVPALIYTCLGLAASGMGSWASIEALIAAFGPGGSITTSWGCTALG